MKEAFLVGGVLMFATSLAGAQELRKYDVGWERDPGAEACPDRAAFVAAVRARVGEGRLEDGAARRLDVRLSRTAAGWRSELRVSEQGVLKGSQQLDSPAPDCSGLFAALVAVAAITIGEEAASEPGEPPTTAGATQSKPPAPQPTALPPPVVPPQRVPQRAPEQAARSRWSLGFDVAQDFAFWPTEADICNRNGNSVVRCFEGDTLFAGNAQPGTNNRVAGGWRSGNQRLLANLQYGLSERVAIELRLGRAFGSDDVSGPGVPSFFPWHVEAGLRFWVTDPDTAFRPYLGGGIGLAQFDSQAPIRVSDCGNDQTDPALLQSCLNREISTPNERQLVAYRKLGKGFMAPRIGAAWSFLEGHALTFGFSGVFTFPNKGFVLEPAMGYAAEL